MINSNHYILDFDSTITQVEAIDELALISLNNHKEKNERLKAIKRLTDSAMEGKVSFHEALKERVLLMQAHKSHIPMLIKSLKKKITPSFNTNKMFFQRHADQVLIVSGGFKEFIIPVVRFLKLKKNQIYANTFVYDKMGNIVGFDDSNPLSYEKGKVRLLEALKLKGKIYAVGDGFSDYQLKQSNVIDKFYAFTENIERSIVKEKADKAVSNFDEFLFDRDLPRSLSYPKSKIRAGVVGKLPEISTQILVNEGYEMFFVDHINQGEYVKDLGLLFCDSNTIINNEFLKLHPKLKVIGFFGNDSQQIDCIAANERGVVVFNQKKNDKKNLKFLANKIVGFIDTGATYKSLNFPWISLPKQEKSHRLIHIHLNISGVVRNINDVLWKHNANVMGQFLRTRNNIGYVITDINIFYQKALLKELKAVKNTIKFRVLY